MLARHLFEPKAHHRWWLTAALCLVTLGAPAQALAAQTPVDIETQPPGATVFIVDAEGEETSLGQTPLKGTRVPRGRITLRFALPGHQGLVETLNISKTRARFVFTLQTATQPALLLLDGHTTFHGAVVSLDGKVAGALPGRFSLKAGRHQISVTKSGFEPWERWVDLNASQELKLSVALSPEKETKSSVIVTSTPSGADVHIGGIHRGKTPTVVSGLTAGEHQVVLSLEGYNPFQAKVTTEDGKQAVLEATMEGAKSRSGNIKILANVEGASVRLDGERLGKAPAFQEGLTPGLHLVEAAAEGHEAARREVTIRAGETTVVRLNLKEKVVVKPAKVRLVCSVAGATVSIDGGPEQGISEPIAIHSAGTHFITVKAPNHAKWTKQFTTAPGQELELVVTLTPQGSLLVESATGGQAEVLINGSLIGVTPLNTQLDVGEHKVTLRQGIAEEAHTLSIKEGQSTSLVAFKTQSSRTGPRAMPWSAKTMGPGAGSLDISLGWPYIGELRINGGITDTIDVGFTFRNIFDVLSEFEGRVKYAFARSEFFAAAAEVSIGGGGGSLDRNSFVFRSMLLGSLFIGESVAMTIRAGGFVYSDRLGPEGTTASASLTPALGEDRRDTALELSAGLTLEFAISDTWNMFVLFEANPVRTGSYQITGEDGEVVELQGRLVLYEGLAGDLKAQIFRGAVGATLLF